MTKCTGNYSKNSTPTMWSSAERWKEAKRMLIQTITSVGFSLPFEYEEMIDFIANINMKEWEKYEDAVYTTFIKRTCNTVTVRGKTDERSD